MDDSNPTGYASLAEALRLLVLRGDGLTTTSLEILTGMDIGVRVLGQRMVDVTDPTHRDSAANGTRADARALVLRRGDGLLVREVALTGADSVVYAVSAVLAVSNRLPATVLQRLLTTPTPLGKALAADGVPVARELRHWGGYRAGRFHAMLGSDLTAASVVSGRTYRIVCGATGAPLAVITEWFAPRLFACAAGQPAATRATSGPITRD